MFFLLLALPAPQTLHLDIHGAANGTDFGKTTVRISDIDGDGFDELAIGAAKENRNGDHSGTVFLYSGSSGNLIWSKNGPSAGRFFGFAISEMGDLDGDQIPDIAISSKRDNDLGHVTGRVDIHSGLDGSFIRGFNSDINWDRFGHSIANAGDINSDGFDDIIISAPNDDWSGPGSGCVRVFSGFDGSLIHLIRGNNPWDLFGWSLTTIGDIDNDGIADFAVGAPRSDFNGNESGYVTAFSGISGSPIFSWYGQNQDALGYSLALVGDCNGDGGPDLVIGAMNDFAHLTQKNGYAEVYSLTGRHQLLHRFDQESQFDAFGSSVAGPGDLNGDGYDDIMVGSPSASANNGSTQIAAGSARIFSGLSGVPLYRLEGDSTNDRLGSSLCGIGDLNLDGLADFVVSEPGGNPTGNVFIYLSEERADLSFSNFVAGATATGLVTDTNPNSPVTFLYTTAGFGLTTYPSGVRLDLAEPISILGTQTADSSGKATLDFNVPLGSSGATIYLQAWSGGGPPPGSATNPTSEIVQ